MFSRATVFIIGAGASAEFGMPAGADLKSRMAAVLAGPSSTDWLLKEGSGPLRELARTIPRFPSIDEALHFHAGNKPIIRIGKLAIADEIIKAERSSQLYGAIIGNPGMINNCRETWASHFLGLALSATKLSDIKRLFANVTIVDFNYDRVLQQYLHWALRQDLRVPKEVVAECVSSLKVLRPYGSIGPLDWQEAGGTAFGGEFGDLHSVADRIRTYTEEAQSDDLQKIKSVIAAAQTIVILGFGYHQQNIEILRIPGGASPRRIFMTTHNIYDANNADIMNAVRGCMQSQMNPHPFDLRAAEFMVSLRPALVMATS